MIAPAWCGDKGLDRGDDELFVLPVQQPDIVVRVTAALDDYGGHLAEVDGIRPAIVGEHDSVRWTDRLKAIRLHP